VSNQGNRDRDREGNLGQIGRDSAKPAGTSGRQDDVNRPVPRPNRNNDDEESGLGNRTTNR
jgi:hypothetical protein